MNLRHKLVGNAAIYLGANVLNAAIPFLLLPLLTRVLSPADYGTLAMFSIVLSVLGAFTGFSVHGAVGVRYFTLQARELADYVGACVGILLLSTIVILMVVAGFGPYLAEKSGVPADWLLFGVVLSGFQFLGNIRLSLWQVQGRARQYGAFQITQSFVNATMSLLFILVVGMAWQGRVLGQAVAILCFGALALYWLRRDGLLSIGTGWRSQVTDALRFGVPLVPHVIGSLLIATSGQFFVTNLFGVSQTGLYVVAVQIGAVVGLIADAFGKSYNPWLFARLKDETEQVRYLIVAVTYVGFAFFVVLSIIACAAMYLLFPFVVGAEFQGARELAFYFILGNGFTGMYLAIAGFFFFTSKTQFVSIVSIGSGLLALALMWSLGRRYGVEGVAAGYLGSQMVMFLFAWWMANRVHPMPWFAIRAACGAFGALRKSAKQG